MKQQEEAITISCDSEQIVFVVIGQGQVTRSDDIEMTQSDALRIDRYSSNLKIPAVTCDTQFHVTRLNPILFSENGSTNGCCKSIHPRA